MGEVLLEARSVSKRLEGDVPVVLVKNASLTIASGEFVVITGPSGSGKSSLLYLLGLLDVPTTGQVLLRGVETASVSENARADLRRDQIGFVFQFHFLLPEFTALENVMIPMQRQGRLSDQAMRERAEGLLAELGLGDHRHKVPRQLSGGQSQRVAIARALANDPALIFADEPTGNLDTASSLVVQDLLIGVARRPGKSVVVVTHDAQFATRAHRAVHIVDGEIEGHGATGSS